MRLIKREIKKKKEYLDKRKADASNKEVVKQLKDNAKNKQEAKQIEKGAKSVAKGHTRISNIAKAIGVDLGLSAAKIGIRHVLANGITKNNENSVVDIDRDTKRTLALGSALIASEIGFKVAGAAYTNSKFKENSSIRAYNKAYDKKNK